MTLAEVMSVTLGDHHSENKKRFHSTALRVLRKLAKRVGYAKH